MHRRTGMLIVLSMLLVFTTTSCWASAKRIVAATGESALSDPLQAGQEAAKKAKVALGKRKATCVLVFDSIGGDITTKQKLLQGVSTSFDASRIYGCSGFAPITEHSNMGSVAVLALSGDIHPTATICSLTNGQHECGKQIGTTLQTTLKRNKRHGALVLLFGDCHVPKNDELVSGAKSVLGESFPIAGASHPLNEFVYYRGTPMQNSNIGLLLTGTFTCGFSAKSAGGIDGIITTAGQAIHESMNMKNEKVAIMLVFDCAGRMNDLGSERPRELQAMTGITGALPLFGLYGSGEIGPQTNGSPASGVGYHIVTCAIAQP